MAPCWRSPMWRQQAEAEGLTLLVADNKAGYFGVYHRFPGKPKPYQAAVRRGGNNVHLGLFATAEEAALCIARSPEGQAAAKRAAEAPPLTSEEARQQAEAEGLTLLEAENTTGYFGVYLDKSCKAKPYQAQVWRGGTKVYLGCFATAEEAALCVARTPEGRAAAAERAAAAPPPLTSEEVRQQARAEGLTLLEADNKTGYLGVCHTNPGKPKPYTAQVRRGGKKVSLGSFATAEEAALCVARSPEGQAAAERAAAPPPLTFEEVRQQAKAEGLTLLKADSTAGYFGVTLSQCNKSKPYEAKVSRGGKVVYLGCFATAEEAALSIARTPEGRAAARRAAAPPPLTSEEARQQARAEGLTLLVADNNAGYSGVGHHAGKPKPYLARVWRGGKMVHLGSCATAEEAALCIARSLRRKELLGRWEQVLAAVGARSAEEEAEVGAAEAAEMELAEAVVPPVPPYAIVTQEREVVVQERRGGEWDGFEEEVEGGVDEGSEDDLAAPRARLLLLGPTSGNAGQDKGVDARNKRHAKLAQARREQELLSQQQQQAARQLTLTLILTLTP